MRARVPRPAPLPPPTPAAPVGQIVVPILGMTCRSCERRIERHVRRIPNVTGVAASAAKARVVVETRGPVSGVDIAEAIEDAGYEVGSTPWLTNDSKAWVAAVVGFAILIALGFIADRTGLAGFASGAGDIREGGLLVAGLLGLAAGVSTCMALVGGLVLALSAAAAAGRAPGAPDPSVAARLRPTLVFLVGRVAGFAALGAGLGALGSRVALPPLVIAALMLVVALVMTILGIRLTGLSPRIAGWSPTLPGGLGAKLGIEGGGVARYSDGRAIALGAASFFLPCGFTQAVQVYALSTGSPVVAGSIMAVFALGTVPGLLALGGLPSLLPAASRPAILRGIGVVVLSFAVLNGMAGLRLAGLTPNVFAGSATVSVEVGADGVQTLRTVQLGNGYSPENVAIYAGVPTRWVIDSQESRSCAIFLQVPSLGYAVTLRAGENVIDLPALRPGTTIPYMCSMGMYGGQITVVDGPPPTDSPTSAGG